MFEHVAFGTVITWVMCQVYGWTPDPWLLTLGAIFGGLPDLLSLFSRADIHGREAYKHRNGLSHSLWLAPLVLLTVGSFDFQLGIIAALAVAAHLVMDTWGIGWGVMLLWPVPLYVKLDLVKGRIFFTQKDIDFWVNVSGSDDMLRDMFFKPGYAQTNELFSMAMVMFMITWPY